MLKYQNPWKSVQWKPSCSMRTDGQRGQTDRNYEANSRFSQFCEIARKCNELWYMWDSSFPQLFFHDSALSHCNIKYQHFLMPENSVTLEDGSSTFFKTSDINIVTRRTKPKYLNSSKHTCNFFYFKLSPRCVCCILSFGWYPGAWKFCADVSEHCSCSNFIVSLNKKNKLDAIVRIFIQANTPEISSQAFFLFTRTMKMEQVECYETSAHKT